MLEVELDDGAQSLALLPTRFRKLIWVKRGDYLLVSSSAGDIETHTWVSPLHCVLVVVRPYLCSEATDPTLQLCVGPANSQAVHAHAWQSSPVHHRLDVTR